MKGVAANGVRKTTCFRLSILRRPEGGCWFCHNQGIEQLRLLRRNYPDLWALMLKWDNDSPVPFKADGHTVHDYDERFRLEDQKIINPQDRFLWSMLDYVQIGIDFYENKGGDSF